MLSLFSYSPKAKPAHARLRFEEAGGYYSEPAPPAPQFHEEIEELPATRRRSPQIQRRASPPIVIGEEPPTDDEHLTRQASFESGPSSEGDEGKSRGPFGIRWVYWIVGAILLVLILAGIAVGLYFGLRSGNKSKLRK